MEKNSNSDMILGTEGWTENNVSKQPKSEGRRSRESSGCWIYERENDWIRVLFARGRDCSSWLDGVYFEFQSRILSGQASPRPP